MQPKEEHSQQSRRTDSIFFNSFDGCKSQMLLWTKRLDDQQDGELVTWGSSVDGGDSSRVQEPLRIHGIRRKRNMWISWFLEFFHDIGPHIPTCQVI